MIDATHAIYDGTVVHKRLRPTPHALRYRVFSLLLDVDQIAKSDSELRLFSYNRFNLFSVYDRDHGDGGSIASHIHAVARRSGHGDNVRRILMLCYPRVLGYVFNPVTVYFGLDDQARVRLLVYEVNNTFGERKTYVLPAEPDNADVINQSCEKRFYVSPFNSNEGRYRFHVAGPGDALTVGVALSTNDGPLLKAHFRGDRKPFGDRPLLRSLARTGWLTAKVMAGIHFEALKLWLKGNRIVRRPPPPEEPITYIDRPNESY